MLKINRWAFVLLLFAVFIIFSWMLLSRGWVRPPKVIDDEPLMWVFDSPGIRYHVPAASPEMRAIVNWIDSHPTGWSRFSDRFSPDDIQIGGQFYAIDFHRHDILLDYTKNKGDDPDSSIHLERRLSTEEEIYWKFLLSRIEKSNSPESDSLPAGINPPSQP